MSKERHFLVLAIAVLMLAFPLCVTAQSMQEIFSQLTDEQLLELYTLLENELSLRGLMISETALRSPKVTEPLVWIPKSGSKYHASSTCSGMKSPIQVELSLAKRLEYTPCKRCRPPQ